jgi:hypothetical protein
VSTGGIPAELPELTVTVYEPELASPQRYVMGTMLGTGDATSGVYALDRDGQWLWYHVDPAGSIPLEIAVASAGGTFIYNRFGNDYSVDDGVLRRMSFDGEVVEEQATPLAHHAFAELPDGSLAWLTLDVRDWWNEPDGAYETTVGDAVVLQPPDGEARTLFSTWDWVEPEKTPLWDQPFYPQGSDWTHGNGLHWDAQRDVLVLSLRNIGTVLELSLDEAQTQAWPLRQLGLEGEQSFVDPEQLYEASTEQAFHMQHDPTFTADSTLLLTTVADATTQVTEYALDDQQMSLERLRLHTAGDGLVSSAMGMARDLPNGNWLVSFGTSGLIQEVTPEGEIAWEIQASAGCSLGDVLLFDDFYELE